MPTQAESALSRAIQAHCLLLSDAVSLDWGVAYVSETFPHLASANPFREINVEDVSHLPAMHAAVSDHYASAGAQCGLFAPSLGQSADELEPFYSGKGAARRDHHVLAVREWKELDTAANARILPARAMRKAMRQVLANAANELNEPDVETFVQANIERLNDHRVDGVVAVVDGNPVGYGVFLEVGDIGFLPDLYVLTEHRRRGVGTSLLDHLLKLAKRLLMRVTCARVSVSDAATVAFLTGRGLAVDGMSTEFVMTDGGGTA
jgi:GNAT superfamily N-acetyltransferase